MHRIGTGQPGNAQHFLDRKIGAHRAMALADQVGFIGLEPVQRQFVFVGIDGNRADAQFVGRAHDADGDLAAVGDQQAFDGTGHGRLPSLDGPLAGCLAVYADYTAMALRGSVHSTSRCLNRLRPQSAATKPPSFQRRNPNP